MTFTTSPLLWYGTSSVPQPTRSGNIRFMPSVMTPHINWTDGVTFRSPPRVTYNGFLPARGTFAIKPILGKPRETITNLEDGFTYAGVRLKYTSEPKDVKKSVYIQWMLERPFQEPTGDFVTSSYIKGRLLLPANSSATLRLVTQELYRDVSAAILRTTLFKTSTNEQAFTIAPKPVSKLYKHIEVNTDTFLRQIVTVALVIGVANEEFILELSQAAESTLSNSIASESTTILDAETIF